MQTAFEHARASVLPDEDVSRDLVKRIRKLRWMGMQEEAEQLQMTLRHVPRADCVIVVPRDTD
jgi:hypothetical protein